MSQITINVEHMKKLVEGRKMLFDEFSRNLNVKEEKVVFNSFDDLAKISEKLAVPVKDFFIESDLDNGVKIGRGSEGFTRTSERNGVKYYTYHHLATTKAEPNLMALRVELHCEQPEKVTLNGGHGSKEIIYVTKGKVRMDWENEKGRHSAVLNVGDSAYIAPGISHSFLAEEKGAELIAVNY